MGWVGHDHIRPDNLIGSECMPERRQRARINFRHGDITIARFGNGRAGGGEPKDSDGGLNGGRRWPESSKIEAHQRRSKDRIGPMITRDGQWSKKLALTTVKVSGWSAAATTTVAGQNLTRKPMVYWGKATVGGQSCPGRATTGRAGDGGHCGADGSSDWVAGLAELASKGDDQEIIGRLWAVIPTTMVVGLCSFQTVVTRRSTVTLVGRTLEEELPTVEDANAHCPRPSTKRRLWAGIPDKRQGSLQ